MPDRGAAEFTYALQEAVAERGPDWRYPTNTDDPEGNWHDDTLPVYITLDGQPGCIIGAALSRVLKKKDMPSRDETAGAFVLLQRYGWDQRAAIAAACAQIHQDWGFTWGDCQIVYVEALNIDRNEGLDIAGVYSAVIDLLVKKHGDKKRWLDHRELAA